MADQPNSPTQMSTLRSYLQTNREAVLWKLDGLAERELRWPMTPTGTNLLGLVKHLASLELGYFGDTFGRPSPVELAWMEPDADPNADMYATADQSPGQIIELYLTAWRHTDQTFDELTLDSPGVVPWWGPNKRHVTLGQIMIHMIAETAQHAGHADIVRELIDSRAGLRADNSNLPEVEQSWWPGYLDRLKRIAEQAGSGKGSGNAR